MHPVQAVTARGGIAHLRSLRGTTSYSSLRAAVYAGLLTRIRNGWYCLPELASTDLARALRVGGLPTCVSAFRGLEGVWVKDDVRLHVVVSRHENHLRHPDDRHRALSHDASVVLHYQDAVPLTGTTLPLTDHVRSLLMCQDTTDALSTVDSLLNGQRVSPASLSQLAATLPHKYATILALADPGAQSGLETKARLALRRRRIAYRSQAYIRGVGRVDLLIGHRLVLELDGRRFHEDASHFEADRRRDLALLEQGYEVIRVSRNQVVFEWPRIEALIAQRVSQRRHRRSA